MLAQIESAAVLGIDAYRVCVEVDVTSGLPGMHVVGLPENAVREGRERVSAALHNSGFELPARRVTINLSPADVRKSGSAFDLPIAVGLLVAMDVIPADASRTTCFVGELGLDGELRPMRGALPIALRCTADGMPLLLPSANAVEAAVAPGARVHGARTLAEVVRHFRGSGLPLASAAPAAPPSASADVDLAEVHGHEHARRALEIAAAGAHNVLLLGPPGAGKSMLARRLPTILPPLTLPEAIEVTRVHSVAGRIRDGEALVAERPFRAPHHSISEAGLIGGGGLPRPGEASLAHHGVLFLDELAEFRRSTLESLRQPLEDGRVSIGRARFAITFPARFMLAAAMNPCPCGYFGDARGRCTCTPEQVRRYVGRVSGPLMDRIDIHLEVPAIAPAELRDGGGESSGAVRLRVEKARDRQLRRLRGIPGLYANAHLRPRDLRLFCRLDAAGESLLRTAMNRLGLSARAYHRILRLARTIADLDAEPDIAPRHVAEAVQYRTLDRGA